MEKQKGIIMGERNKNKRQVGKKYEQQAAEYLRQKGYEILEQNYYTPCGEIDLIAKKDGYLVFVEVKYRGNGYEGAALEAVDSRKQHHIVKSAFYYLYGKHYGEDTPCRFDVIAYERDSVCHIQNAFEV